MNTIEAVVAGANVRIYASQVLTWKKFAANVIDGTLSGGATFRAWIDESKWKRFLAGELE
jgi:hypothetical protein